MREFFKKNMSMIVKMFVNQIAMMIFGLVLSMATYQNETLYLATSVFAICFYMVLLYTMSWETGISDKIRVDAGRQKYEPHRYIFVSLAANSINILLALLAIIGFAINGFSYDVNIEWAYDIYGICNNIARFIQGMYYGLLSYVLPHNPFGLILIVLPSVASCWLGYYIGVKGRTIRSFFGIKTAYDNVLQDNKIKHDIK